MNLDFADGTDAYFTSTTDVSGSPVSTTVQNAAQVVHELDKMCPPQSTNSDYDTYCAGGATPDADWCAGARAMCGNENPYSPKCVGKSCPLINILEGDSGEFYISRFDNSGNNENDRTPTVDDPIGAAGNKPQNYYALTK